MSMEFQQEAGEILLYSSEKELEDFRKSIGNYSRKQEAQKKALEFLEIELKKTKEEVFLC